MPMTAPAPEDHTFLDTFAASFGGTVENGFVVGAKVAGQDVEVWGPAASFHLKTADGQRYSSSELKRFVRMTLGLFDGPAAAANDNDPVDLWAERERPSLPYRLLPEAIEDFARNRASQMGVDPGGVAMAALTVCASAISDDIKLRVKAHDDWHESARLWSCLVGSPSSKKSPILRAATAPLMSLNEGLIKRYSADRTAYDQLGKDAKAAAPAPKNVRTVIMDVTVEAAQDILKDNPQGLLMLRDELSGWFGAMEKYGSAKGSAADRAVWLEAFNGGAYTTDRVGRGMVHVQNLSVCLLGGIQPEPIRSLARDAHDDGLLQRILPIVLGPARVGQDEPPHASTAAYDALIRRLHALGKPRRMAGAVPMEVPLRFSADAQELRHEMEAKHHAMQATWESVNRKLASHIGKYDSFFARLCIVFHCIESVGATPAEEISFDTADKVAQFLHQYLFPHALAFYSNVLGLSDQHDRVLATAGFILARDLTVITPRDVMRGDRAMRSLSGDEAADILEKLDAFGWLEPESQRNNQHTVRYRVRPAVHDKFAERAEAEEMRRERVRESIREATT